MPTNQIIPRSSELENAVAGGVRVSHPSGSTTCRDLTVAGTITGGTIPATYQDVAEWVPSVQKLAAGTVVVLDTGRTNHVLVSASAYDTKVEGVVSAEPGVILGVGGEGRGDTYLYRVRAVDGSGARSAPGPVAMATAITFADGELIGANDPQGRPATRVKADHVNDLRVAVAGVRSAALLAISWQEEASWGVPVMAEHVRELRRELDEGLAALGLPVNAYADPQLNGSPNGTPIRKIHFEQLRDRSTRGTGVTGSGISAYDFASARLDPSNRTGGGGIDLYSRNFNWRLPLAGLPGRAGLNLGLSLSYNSLVWTKSGSAVLFDGDWGWPSPGFRLGFPVVQWKFYDAQAAKNAYMLITPSGAHVSLRQIGTTAVYEAGDSSRLQLTEEANGSLTLRTTDGTKLTYWWAGGVFKCAEIKGSNGNFITATYNVYGNLETVKDTAGRTLTFNYDASGYPETITQTWHREVESGGTVQTVTETHEWARFYYADKTVRTNFTGLTVYGPANGQTFRALTKVRLAGEASYTFGYTTWGQINQIAEYAADNHLLNYVSLDLPADETQAQGDCPRPTERRDWASHWNGDENGVPVAGEEAVTAYGAWNFAGGVAHATAPDGTTHQESYLTSGWQKGLVTRADEFSAEDHQNPKKWMTMAWTQDDEALQYQQNPRVRETNVYDANDDGSVRDRRRTEIVYTSLGLASDVKEYDADAVTVLRRTHTEYAPESVSAGGAYALRRIIGLPSEQTVYGRDGGQEKLFSKASYEYDLVSEGATQFLVSAGTVQQHDSANFGTSFTTRGNVCCVRRWDVSDATNQSKSVATAAGYNTLGSAVFTSDAVGHKTSIAYTDSDGGARLAYPTSITDAENFTSTVEYNYDTGAVVRAVDPKGATTKSFYDPVGRRLKVKSEVNGAYMRWEYGASERYVKQLTIVDAGQAETFVLGVTDGAGRAATAGATMRPGTSRRATRTSALTTRRGCWWPSIRIRSATAGASYRTQDVLGSTRVVTGTDGQPKSRHDFLPFGEEIAVTLGGRGGSPAAGYNPGSVKQKFTGKERDAEMGLDYFGARYFADSQGRFTSADSISWPATGCSTRNA